MPTKKPNSLDDSGTREGNPDRIEKVAEESHQDLGEPDEVIGEIKPAEAAPETETAEIRDPSLARKKSGRYAEVWKGDRLINTYYESDDADYAERAQNVADKQGAEVRHS